MRGVICRNDAKRMKCVILLKGGQWKIDVIALNSKRRQNAGVCVQVCVFERVKGCIPKCCDETSLWTFRFTFFCGIGPLFLFYYYFFYPGR